MNAFDEDKEWAFIQKEVHNFIPNKADLIKRELIFFLQILLLRDDIELYMLTKKLYLLKCKIQKLTETGKKMFIRFYEESKAIGDSDVMDFCAQILEVYEINDVNGHIVWKK